MATLLLSAVGAAIGSSFSGTVLGLSGAVIGRAVGATLGRVIDQRLLGQGSEPVETGKIDRYRLSGVGEGTPVAMAHGRMRLGGQVIWTTHFKESARTTGGGGKGAPSQPKTTTYSYSVSLALALCEGEILRVGRIWADGTLIERDQVALRIYRGTEDQMPDPKMEAVEGAGQVPAYRGIAYVVIEDLDLTPYGNRVPQFSFEVVRAAPAQTGVLPSPVEALRAVAMIPGTGEYALATTPVTFRRGVGASTSVNLNTPGGETDFSVSLDALREELPNCGAVSLVVSWFGDDLRAGHCSLRPKVEQKLEDGAEMPWSVSGVSRAAAGEIAKVDGRPVYGGTPADAAVIEAIEAMNAGGQEVMLYPFVLMEILPGNGKPDPWSDATDQPILPWRGRITGDVAPGRAGTTDRTAANGAAVDAFFGTVTAADFVVGPGSVTYSGPDEWTYSRFILHMAALCAAAGGVSAFCVGSELRSLTQMRDESGFPAVERLRALAAEVRALLPGTLISYAADWSEYFGYQPQDGSGDVLFHLDPLWADDNIDFIGIDNYMPVADWRDGAHHADAEWQSIYNPDYLMANIEGGEGYDWYYPSAEAREAQIRVPITDGAGGTPWVYRYKDIRNWWSNLHVDRRNSIDRSILPDGAAPETWSAIGGATVAPAGESFGLYAGAARVAGGGAAVDGIGSGSGFAAEADQQYEILVHFRHGTFNRCRLVVGGAPGSVEIACGPGDVVSVSGDTGWVEADEVVDAGDGVRRLRVLLRLPVAAALSVSFGPDSDEAGADVILFGVDVTPWPVQPTAWVPMSKPVWFTEFGCAAIDKGANQPNLFLDPKSSESAMPHFSNGRRDDLMQAQHLRAVTSYWADPGNNPISPVYGGPMIDCDHMFAWAWDARPYPAFPNDLDRWSDGANYATGHWLQGRSSNQPLDLVVAGICAAARTDAIDVSGLYGSVRGHLMANVDTARARIQPLMLAYDFTAVEQGGKLVFRHLPLLPDAVVEAESIAVEEEAPSIKHVRAPDAETVGRVRVTYSEADGAFETRIAEALFPDDTEIGTSHSELPLSLTRSEARSIADRWLAGARVSRDSLELALPPSMRAVGAGHMIALADGSTWRVDRVEDLGLRRIEASRVEPTLAAPPDATEITVAPELFVPPVPVEPLFMDLPLMNGDEVPHAPHIAVAATPWPGSVAVYSSPSDSNYTLNRLIEGGSAIGLLETPLAAAEPGVWDRGPALRVRLVGEGLSSAAPVDVLNGANVAAIGQGDGGPWELIQFAEATLVAPDLWEIGMRLRGQAGTDCVMPPSWPAGSYFVLIDGRPQQIDLAASARGLARHYRVGPARRAIDDQSYTDRLLAFDGVGLRPYRPAHLRVANEGADRGFSWTRRTRTDGDSWQGTDVPLGEDSEAYLVRVSDSGGVRRETTVTVPAWTYTAAAQAADGTASPFIVEVAQISARYGPGPFARIDIDD
ncbi:host specificity protein [Rhodobacterales bacterium HKCCE2091]|nr:host specificity protein [Rhodobacterales bacterium HKCCE2091]